MTSLILFKPFPIKNSQFDELLNQHNLVKSGCVDEFLNYGWNTMATSLRKPSLAVARKPIYYDDT